MSDHNSRLLTIYLPCLRWGGLDVIRDSLLHQTIWSDLLKNQDVELLFVDENALDPRRIAAVARLRDELSLLPDDVRLIFPSDYKDGRMPFMKQNRAHNVMFQVARGVYLAECDDNMVMGETALETLLQAAEDYADAPVLLNGVMHTTLVPPQTALNDDPDADLGYSVFKKDFHREDWGWPHPMTSWRDARGGKVWAEVNCVSAGPRQFTINYQAWENNVSIARTDLLREIGADEEMDFGGGPYNHYATLRLFEMDPKAFIIVDASVVTYGLPHRTYKSDTPHRDIPANIDYHTINNLLVKRIPDPKQHLTPPEVDHLTRNAILASRAHTPDTAFLADIARADRFAPTDKGVVALDVASSRMGNAGMVNPLSNIVYLRDLKNHTRRSIAFYLPATGNWGDFDPAMPFAKALGGRETATIRLAQELAKMDWNVGLFCPCPFLFQDGNLVWHPHQMFTANLRAMSQTYDVIVSIEDAQIFKRLSAKLHILHEQCCHLRVLGADKNIDHYFLLSQYQQWSLRSYDATINPDKCVVFGNGVDLERYDFTDVQPVPGRLVYSSSPDRGLHHLLDWWPELTKRHPELSLKVFYNPKALQDHRWEHDVKATWALAIEEGEHLPGVEYVGGIDQMTLAREQKQAQMWVYPCDPSAPTESWCVTALEHAAAGVPMLMSDADCLGEIYHDVAWLVPMPIKDSQWINAICYWLEHPDEMAQSIPLARAFAEKRTWRKVAGRWSDFLQRRLELKARTDLSPEEAAEKAIELGEDFTYMRA